MSEPVREILPETAPETDGAPQAETGAAPAPAAENAPLHWHNFLVKFMLWIAAAYHLFQCVWLFSGRIYFSAAEKNN